MAAVDISEKFGLTKADALSGAQPPDGDRDRGGTGFAASDAGARVRGILCRGLGPRAIRLPPQEDLATAE